MLTCRVPFDVGHVELHLRRDEAQEFVADLQRLLEREAAEQPDEADLIGEPQAIVVAAALVDLGQISPAQGGFTDHLSLRNDGQHHGWSHSH
jgi:hypothetical protein